MADEKTVNKVKASGKVVAKTPSPRKDGSYMITLFTKVEGRDNYPRFYCPAGVLPDIEKNERVLIYGHVHTYVKRTPEGKNSFRQQFIADKVTKEKTLTELAFGEKGTFYPPMYANVFFKGTIRTVKPNGEWAQVYVTVDDNGKDANIKINAKENATVKSLSPGDKVYIVSGIRTTQKEVNGKRVTFENISLFDIHVVKNEEENIDNGEDENEEDPGLTEISDEEEEDMDNEGNEYNEDKEDNNDEDDENEDYDE